MSLRTVWIPGLRASVLLPFWSTAGWITGGLAKGTEAISSWGIRSTPTSASNLLFSSLSGPGALGPIFSELISFKISWENRDVQEIKEEEGLNRESRPKVWVSKTWLGCGGPRTELHERTVWDGFGWCWWSECKREGQGGQQHFAESEERNECQETQEQELVAVRLGETVT